MSIRGPGTVVVRPLASLVTSISPPARADREAVQRHLDSLTKPPGSLGRLEQLALRLSLIYGDPPPPLRERTVYVIAADHGVARRGVSAYPPEVTAQMCHNYVSGRAAVSAIARTVGARVVAVDIGVDADLSRLSGLLQRKVRRGTDDLTIMPALKPSEVARAILVGAALIKEATPVPDLVALGEMGIGNTTAAAALTAVLCGARVESVLGRGTGVSDEILERKRSVVEAAVSRIRSRGNPLSVVSEVGGLEIAGLAGVVLGAAAAGRAVITDGFIATAAALVAARLCPDSVGYLFASHCSGEPGHRILLDELGLEPLFELEMRLGEGTGATLAMPILEAAGAILRDMVTFEEARLSGPIERSVRA